MLSLGLDAQHNIAVSVCVYMYAYVHIKAQTYIYVDIYQIFQTLSLNRKFQKWNKSHAKVKEETGRKPGTAETQKKNSVHSVLSLQY